jgi:elongation factor 1-beta
MGVAVVKIKLMPDSPETNTGEVQKRVEEILSSENVKNPMFEIHPIAFGLKALVVMFGWPEEKALEGLEESLKKITGIKSVEVVDIRRAIG